MAVPIVAVALACVVMFLLIRGLERRFQDEDRGTPRPPAKQPNEDDPELMAWIDRKLRHLEE